MSNATNKLEMSLDDIIKTQKGGKGQNQANKAGLNPRVFKGPINKRRQVETPKGNRRIGIRRQMGGGANNNRNGQLKGRKVVVKRQQMKFGGNLRQNVGNRFGGIRKNVTTNALKNKAMVSVTRNLVQKLAKKALAQNVGTSSVMTRRSSKLIRIPANRLRQRTIVLNKVNPRSRVIARRRVLSMQNSPVMLQKVRGRGPVRFAQNAQPRIISLPSRRNTIQYAQQPIVVQQPRRNFNNNNNAQQGMSVRQQINAMRRATRVQQLQSQFIKQQQAPNIQMQQRRFVQPPRQQQVSQQQVIVQQQRPRRQQYIILQQQPQRRRQQQQFVTVQQQPRRFFNRQQQRGQGRQQIIQLDPLYNPPNFLQRI